MEFKIIFVVFPEFLQNSTKPQKRLVFHTHVFFFLTFQVLRNIAQ